jgi:CTP-dependent riboflavin kinase
MEERMDELKKLAREVLLREMEDLELIERQPGVFCCITEKGWEWLYELMKATPKADELAEALRNSRTYTLEEWNAMVEMSGKKKS